jgi:tripartite-type tricarboxylate transporter receptor subunit TctC
MAGMALAGAGLAAAQPYPAKPVRLIVGFAPGGGTDVLARSLAQQLTESLGQPFTVDNRTGAGGIISAELGAKAPPDGYTLLVGSLAAFAINPNLMAKLPYDPVRDFAPVGMFATLSYAVDVHPSLPVKSVRELIALAKMRPGQLNYGSAGTGSSTHLAIEQFLLAAGVRMTHVPYKGNAPAMTALMSGEIAMVFDPVLTSAPLARAGRLRALAVTTAKRSGIAPELPTMGETFKGFEMDNWYAMFLPAGTPQEIVQRLNAETLKAMKAQDVVDFMARDGADPVGSSPAELAAYLRREIDKYARIIKAGGIQPE